MTGYISGYYTSFSDFIDFTPTGDFEDGLRVFDYTPKNAEFVGGEAQVDLPSSSPNDDADRRPKRE